MNRIVINANVGIAILLNGFLSGPNSNISLQIAAQQKVLSNRIPVFDVMMRSNVPFKDRDLKAKTWLPSI